MTIEETLFGRKRFDPARMLQFGFQKNDGGFSYTADFMNGDFSAILSVSENGNISGAVIDNMNCEVYAPLRAANYTGAYVSEVRAAYEAFLLSVADACCIDVPFVSDQANRITGRIFRIYGVRPDFPWGEDPYDGAGTFRHKASKKWFALIMRIRWKNLLKNGDETPLDAVNLKIKPETLPVLLQKNGVFPAYHMNHTHWITAVLDDTLSDDEVLALIDLSFQLTKTNKDCKQTEVHP